MLPKFKTVREGFKNEKECLKFLAYSRWGNNIKCPYCQHEKVYIFKNEVQYKCAAKTCRKIFNAKTNTFLQNSKIKLMLWMEAINLIVSNGMSSHQLAKHLGITQKTSWYMFHRVRKGMFNEGGIFKGKLGKSADSIVEVDETFVGGKNKNRHWDKKVKNNRGRSFKDKVPVLGMLERNGKVKVAVVPDTKRKSILPIVKKNVVKGCRVMSDEWWAYHTLNINYDHRYVNHGAGQYAYDEVHTNGIENFWSHYKRRLRGVYIHVSKKHMEAYAQEAAFRYNTKDMPVRLRMFLLFHNSNGAGLLYKDLIAA